jgi:paraquat-inducible protein A
MRARTAAFAMAGLILFVPAVTWPILKIERLGHLREDHLVGGVVSLLQGGHLFIGLVVLLFSLIVPPAKLSAMLWLAAGAPGGARKHQALAHRIVEWLGRWGMLDVLLVAVLVAFVKLGDVIQIQAGPGLIAFGLCVLASLAASLSFDPHEMWRGEPVEREVAT